MCNFRLLLRNKTGGRGRGGGKNAEKFGWVAWTEVAWKQMGVENRLVF